MDEKKLQHRLNYLANVLFVHNPEGKEFVRLMKLRHINFPVFPQPAMVIEQHGGAVGWAGYRAGQLELLYSFDVMAREYLDKIAAENTKEHSE